MCSKPKRKFIIQNFYYGFIKYDSIKGIHTFTKKREEAKEFNSLYECLEIDHSHGNKIIPIKK